MQVLEEEPLELTPGNTRDGRQLLQLERLLGSQQMQSALQGRPAHDEMLFIIVHQAYELWFKQILWELDAMLAIFGGSQVPEEGVGRAVSHCGRIIEIQRVLIDQVDVLETMTPLDFLDFRDDLMPASGFQSVQFRLIDPEPLLFYNETILRDGKIVGTITSGNYGHHLGGAIGLGYVPCAGENEADVLSSAYEIEIAGERFAAEASLKPMYDPKAERVRV